MAIDIKVPPVGESITEGTLARWLKRNGEPVREGEPLFELETDKATGEVPAPGGGVLRIDIKEGETVAVGAVVGSIDPSGTPSTKSQAADLPVVKPPAPVPSATPPMAEPNPTPEISSARQQPTGETREPMSRIRKTIADRLVAAQHTAAILTTVNEADMSEIIAIRAKYKDAFKERHGIGIGYMSFFIKASIEALKAFPVVNARIEDNDIVHPHRYDIGVAVSTERGLMVPVIRNADQLSFAELEKTIDAFAVKARDGKISVDDLRGGTFTITNGGVFGSLLSTPILNPPQSAILGMHTIQKRPVVVNDQIVIRPMMYLALSYDHRLIDGRDAVQFLVKIKECVEYPLRVVWGL